MQDLAGNLQCARTLVFPVQAISPDNSTKTRDMWAGESDGFVECQSKESEAPQIHAKFLHQRFNGVKWLPDQSSSCT